MKIGVIGCGNVGYAFLTWLRKRGHDAIGYDIDVNVQNIIKSELGSNAIVTTISELNICDCIFICVPTEPSEDGSADMSIYETVIDQLANLLKATKKVSVVQRSTCPPGSADRYANKFSDNVSYGVNPSFLRKASIVYDTENPDRIAIGGSGLVKEHLEFIYTGIDAPQYITDNRTSVELLKYVENTIDAMLISYWNEILEYCVHLNLDSIELIRLIEHISDREKFKTVSRVPGKAFGLWCLPKDLNALLFEMDQKGINHCLLKGVNETNKKFDKKFGTGTVPAKSLWLMENGHVKILQDGKKQIENYYIHKLK